MDNFDIGAFAMMLVPLLFAITVHEASHAWAAKKLGDNTAFLLGRVTLNPIKHIDPIGTVLVPIVLWILTGGGFTFGWAKPVPFNPRYLKNYKRDIGLIAVAGPASNIIMAILWTLLGFLIFSLNEAKIILISQGSIWLGFILMAKSGVVINLVFAIFNMVPLPPLDGGRIAVSLLPYKPATLLARIEPYGFYIIIALLASGILSSVLGSIINVLARQMLWYLW